MKLKQDLYNMRFAIIIILIYFIFAQTLFGNICPFIIITNKPCPACGLTRASLCICTGEFSKAIEYNESVFLWWITIILFIVDRYIHKIKFFIIIPIITCIITIMIYLIKIFN